MSTNYQPQVAQVLVNATNSSTSPAIGSTFQLFTGAGFANGSVVTAITVKALGATGAGMIRIFTNQNAGGTANLLYEVPVPATNYGTAPDYSPTWGITIPCNIPLTTTGFVYITAQDVTSNFVVTANAYSIEGWS